MDPEDNSEITEQDNEILEDDAVEVLQLDDEEAMFEGILRDTIHHTVSRLWSETGAIPCVLISLGSSDLQTVTSSMKSQLAVKGWNFAPTTDPLITISQKSNYCQLGQGETNLTPIFTLSILSHPQYFFSLRGLRDMEKASLRACS